MKRPNSKRHNPDPEYLAGLFSELRSLGRNRTSVCEQIGVNYRTMNDYLAEKYKFDYCVQFALEMVLFWERELSPVTHVNNVRDGWAKPEDM